ncbi:hypothetical protein GOV09_01520, partial [Candidatus Woesearchaeota archaeon]|nr:hypothetical protein [Candidatus Woesearchaeota archaeon]
MKKRGLFFLVLLLPLVYANPLIVGERETIALYTPQGLQRIEATIDT